MMKGLFSRIIFLFVMALYLAVVTSCIHEYPNSRSMNPQVNGEDPTKFDAFIEVEYDLDWQCMLHHTSTRNTRARTERPHRMIIEVADETNILSREVITLTDNEFLTGRLTRKIPVKLEGRLYYLGAWYDHENNNGEFSFDANTLSEIALINKSTTDASVLDCGFASEIIDLREYDPSEEKTVIKQLQLSHPGARFEIVATDVQQFITDQKEALYQGDSFTVKLTFEKGNFHRFNLYSDRINQASEDLILSGRMRLPYAEYDELKIAEGFLFCREETTVKARLSVVNSALVTVSQSDYFNFPIKPGYITTVTGDFLTNSVDGIFSIDHIWEGEIVIEL